MPAAATGTMAVAPKTSLDLQPKMGAFQPEEKTCDGFEAWTAFSRQKRLHSEAAAPEGSYSAPLLTANDKGSSGLKSRTRLITRNNASSLQAPRPLSKAQTSCATQS